MTTERKHPTLDKILAFLARNGPCSKWQIAKALGLSYGNIYATIKDLLEDELIRIVETRTSGKNKKIEVEYYGLTLLGFLVALTAIQVKPENKALIVSIIEKQSHLHPLFARWNTLMQQVPQTELFRALSNAADSTYDEWNFHVGYYKRVNRDLTNYFTEKMLNLVQHDYYSAYLSSIDKWLEAIRQDKELKSFVEARIRETIIKERENLAFHEKLLKTIG